MSRFGIYKIDGVQYDLDDMTLDEMEAIEEACGGTPFGELNFGSAKTMKAIALTLIRRSNPDATIESIGSTKMIDLIPADEEQPPLPPGEGAESQNGSDREGSGAPASPAPIPG